LDKCIIFLHVNADQFPKWRKQHFQIFTLGGFFGKIHDKECFIGGNIFASIIFLALDATIATRKFRPHGSCDFGKVPAFQMIRL